MKHLKSILFFLLTSITIINAQKIHSPFEIIQIMNDSKVMYTVNTLKEPVECPDYSKELNYHDAYRVLTDSSIFTLKYKINEKAKPLLDKAEEYFEARNLNAALDYYKQALEADSSQYYIMTYIGQIYDGLGDYTQSIAWYQKAIEINYIDYMAHWFLADAFFVVKEYKKAVDEIIIARILNRNNPRIKASMDIIFKKAKLNTADWCFNPQVKVSKTGENEVTIEMGEKWTAYAMAKALWSYEPGYKESMGIIADSYSTLEERECLIVQLIGMENAKTKVNKDPQLKILKKAGETKHLNDYILYEIFLPRIPSIAFQLPEETILSIKDYVLNVRHAKK